LPKKSTKSSSRSSGYVQKGKPLTGRRGTRTHKKTPERMVTRLWKSISAERKLDILGIIVSLLGVMSLISLVARQHGTLTQWWVNVMFKGFGGGAFILRLAL